MRILLAVDGSDYSDAAAQEVASRRGHLKVKSRLLPPLNIAYQEWNRGPYRLTILKTSRDHFVRQQAVRLIG